MTKVFKFIYRSLVVKCKNVKSVIHKIFNKDNAPLIFSLRECKSISLSSEVPLVSTHCRGIDIVGFSLFIVTTLETQHLMELINYEREPVTFVASTHSQLGELWHFFSCPKTHLDHALAECRYHNH